MKRVFAVLIFLIALQVHSQDVHFSQSVASFPQKNPAFRQIDQADFQVLSIYREQWGSIGVPFKTAGFYLESLVYQPILGLKLHAGLLYLNDQSGDAKLLINQVQLNLGASYQLGLNTFHFGLANGFRSVEFNPAKLTFPEQYDRSIGNFNRDLPSGENFNNQKDNQYQMHVGLAWDRVLNDVMEIKTGMGFENVNGAEASFLDENLGSDLAWNFQSQLNYQFLPKMSLLPLLSYQRSSKASETITGLSLRMLTASLGNVHSIEPFLYSRLGVQRNIDALIIGTYLTINPFRIGASYDFNVSDLELASDYQGAFELTLSYVLNKKSIQKRAIPCERY